MITDESEKLTGLAWRLLDGIGPFFKGLDAQRINWSKIPFAFLEEDGVLRADLQRAATEDFRRLVNHAVALGFNGITLDDLAHGIVRPEYPAALQEKLHRYREWYHELFAIAVQAGCRPFITTDIMFYNEALRRLLGDDLSRIQDFLAVECANYFREFPEVAGLITRIGESDGLDVNGDFRSELSIRTPRQARALLSRLLPVFERHERIWIWRTWSVGAYPIGDLMWNRRTCARVFGGIESPSLLVSFKYGESDFFRYLPLNKQFFRGTYRKIIELQARREYEGFGEYPSFIGWDYENYARQLKGRADLAGISVWCQTGGWSSFKRITYGTNSSPWNELNTQVSIAVFHKGQTVEQAVAEFCRARWMTVPVDRLLTFLRLSDEVVKELLYIDEFSQRKLFFRRVRVPPLCWVFWDQILINHSMRKILRCFVTDGEAKVQQGRLALMKIREMKGMAMEWGWPGRDLQFQYDTFEILAVAREYYFRPFREETALKLKALTRRYRKKYRSRYVILLNFDPLPLNRRLIKRMLGLGLRDRRGYRVIDRLLTLRLLSFIYPLVRRFRSGPLSEFAERQGMGWDALFR